MEKNKRYSNIELLRLLIMLGIIVLHYYNKSIGGRLKYVSYNSINYFILILIESLCICAVDLFMLISGYFYCKEKSNITKV